MCKLKVADTLIALIFMVNHKTSFYENSSNILLCMSVNVIERPLENQDFNLNWLLLTLLSVCFAESLTLFGYILKNVSTILEALS